MSFICTTKPIPAKMSITSSNSSLILISLLLSFFVYLEASSSTHGNFLQCLYYHSNVSIPVYTPKDSNYSTILQSTLGSLRLNSSATPKPFLIVTPLTESHVQTAVICSKNHGIQIKVRSGGHDFEGLSYISDVPFIIVDLFNLREVNVDVKDKIAWVQSGATTGELYYKIAKKSNTLAFPAGMCTTVGIGGHFSGGGYGSMLRKYGTAGDNVIDARIVDVHGRILNRKSMGDGLFWAIRGGGGGSFGIVLSWKIRLVSVPPTVTVFSVGKTLAERATSLVRKWQKVAHKLPHDLFIMLGVGVVDSTPTGNKTILTTFTSLFLGDSKKLQTVMKERFPELGLEAKDCIEMSWLRSVLFLDGLPTNGSIDILVNRPQPQSYFKVKSDYVKQPISQIGLGKIWERTLKDEQNGMMFMPYGGRMSQIAESETPFSHRNGTLFKIIYLVYWDAKQDATSQKYINQIRRMYEFMTPYVSKSPREAYVNYRDLDLGQTSKNGTASYSQAKVWGTKYFKDNFDRLVYVKTKVDPDNFFRHEQSIPSIAY
ncbi:berberine bridge enzyme-like 8 [Papaver somniferum]|uniref:berberine bridge enzyme-like 8 n=1 Tax=Papaver somniferum TaxID=3469 RepID=UPI000E6F4995|nr:berberine bridge enzyme-like 8 [Papaver somniferum]